MPAAHRRLNRSVPLFLFVVLVWLPRVMGQRAITGPVTSQPATSNMATDSQPSDRETELREGRRIIEEAVAAYRNCRTYQDEGSVVTVWNTIEGRQTIRKSFQTAFVRPGQFRFETRDGGESRPYIICKKLNVVRTWERYQPADAHEPSLGVALDTAIGASSGSANKIPALLLPNEEFLVSLLGQHRFFGRAWTGLRNVRYTEQEKSRGVLYNILEAERYEGEPVHIWIDSKTKLVCKVVEEMNILPQGRVIITTIYKPKINADIPAADFELNPPKE